MTGPQELQTKISALGDSLKSGPLADKAYVAPFLSAATTDDSGERFFPEFFEDFHSESLSILETVRKTVDDFLAGRTVPAPQLFDAFRLTHTLKGSAATMGFIQLSQMAHGVEKVFESLKDSIETPKREVVLLLQDGFSLVEELVSQLKASK